MPTLLRVGLTGGIASGKTTVAGFLRELGAFVIDADRLAHRELEPDGRAYDAIRQRFGDSILDKSGAIDRRALGRIVFGDEQARRSLNELVHPHVRAEAARRIAEQQADERCRLVVFDAALLYETGAWREQDRIIVVRCSLETQIRRICSRNGLTVEQARARIAGQAPLEEKLAIADHVVDTDGTIEDTRRQTRDIHDLLMKEYRQRHPAAGTDPGTRPS